MLFFQFGTSIVNLSPIVVRAETIEETIDPEANDPEASDPQANDPEASDPQASDPEASDPEADDPEINDPADQLEPDDSTASDDMDGFVDADAGADTDEPLGEPPANSTPSDESTASDQDPDDAQAPNHGQLFALNPGETIKEIAQPDQDTYKVMVGTAFEDIGLQTQILVVYILPDDTEEGRQEDIEWKPVNPANPYNAEQDGVYELKAHFVDQSLVEETIDGTVTVTVKGKALADEIIALPTVEAAGNLSQEEKYALRSKLIEISNALALLTAEEQAALEAYVGFEQMGKYEDLYGTYVMGDGSIAERLNGDWAYISRFELASIHDGTGPFDTSDDPNDPHYKNRQGNDSGPNNGIVRSFDTVTYDLSYSTAVSGEYAGIKEGYMYYEFVLPFEADQAEWEFTGMTWIGIKVNSKADLEDKTDGENYYHYEKRLIDGVMSQVITGKRYLVPVSPNPCAFPGAGTLNAVVRVLNMDNGSTLKPKFSVWLEHNHLDGTCSVHDRVEPKSLVGVPVTVSSELRLNVQLRAVSMNYANGLDTFDFSTGNNLALNKDAGNVYGRLSGYGITIQLYNLDPDDGLKGVAIPEGPITFDMDFSVKYRLNNGTMIEDLDEMYTPLVWSYGINNSISNQLDGRDIATYVPACCARNVAPSCNQISGNPAMGTYSPPAGTVHLWKAGTWSASQEGSKVSFTIEDYEINPNWFPNADLGDSYYNRRYFNPENGVRSTNIGCFTAAKVFVITPFGEGDDYLPVVHGNGTVKLELTDSNLRAGSSTAGNLPIVSDNSNQTKPNRLNLPLNDDIVSRTVYLAMPGTYDNMLRYIYSDTGSIWTGIDKTDANLNNGKDVATRDQTFAIAWGGVYNPNGERANAVYGLNALMKFDPTGLELVKVPRIHSNSGSFYDPKMEATFLYAVKKDGTAWADDDEMDGAIESDLDYYKTLEEAQEHGIVVGILAEGRNKTPKLTHTFNLFSVQVKARSDAPTNRVYQIVERCKVWRGAEYEAAGGVLPRRYDNPNSIIDYPATPLDDWRTGTYTKAKYEDGAYVGGHSGNSNIGDSVYVTPYMASILIEVAQQAGGDQKKNYDLDTNQRTVDFRLSPSVSTWVPITNEIYTEVVIVDVLPKGLSYISNSAYYGGTYTQHESPGRQGTITGGEQLEPTSDYDPNTGKTTLTWSISNVRVNDPMPHIIYSATIGEAGTPDDVKNGDDLLNAVSISATDDKRAKTKANGNYAEVGITVSKLLATSIAKLADYKYVEAIDDISWKAYVSNNGTNPYADTVILDVLPYNGDAGGSKFNPDTQFELVDWSVDIDLSTVKNLPDWRVFYTSDVAVQGTRSHDYAYNDIIDGSSTLPGGVVTWIEATLDPATGIITGVTNNVTAMACLGTLNSAETLVQNIKLRATPKLKAGDVLANTISRDIDEASSTVNVLQRTLEGLLWHDVNADGVRQSEEAVFANGTVTLLKETAPGVYEPYLDSENKPLSISLGQQININTGVVTDYADHKYKFVGLPAGIFGVRFETEYISDYKASPQNVGSDYTDSDAEAELVEGFLQSTIIKGIKMPAKNEIASSLYASRFNDSGLYLRKVSIPVTKEWDDDSDRDGKRADSIKVQLSADGSTVPGKTLVLNDANNWTGTFADLDEYSDGQLIVYTVDEVEVPTGYSRTINGSVENGFTIKNKYTPETLDINGTKTWDDDDDRDGKRPDSITVRLWADDTESDSRVVTEDDGWAWSFTKLLKYRDGGEVIVYKVTEDTVADYTPTVSEDGFSFTNKYIPETLEIAGEKTWDDDDNRDGVRPASITIRLLADGDVIDSRVVNEEADWAWSFTKLPKYRDGGTEIDYTITEDAVEDYSADVDVYDVKNTHTPGKTSIQVTKVWDDADDQDGVRPDSVTIRLLADGVETGKTISLSESNNWTDTFVELDIFKRGEVGQKIVYTVEEVPIEVESGRRGYLDPEVAGDVTKGYVVTNTRAPEVVDISGTKTWDDNEDQDGMRPVSITIRLLADGEEDDSRVVTEEDGWAWSFTGLPKYRDGGTEIVYTITEDSVEGYDADIDGYDVMNTHTPSKTTVRVVKIWDDKENIDGSRPESVTIHLFADGVDTEKTLILTADSEWKGEFTDLDEYKDGQKIVYTIDEELVDGYIKTIFEAEARLFVVKNFYNSIVSPTPTTGESLGIYPLMGALLLAFGVLLVRRGKRIKR